MRLPLLPSMALLTLLAAGACSFEPRYPVEPGAAPGRGVVMTQPAYPIDAPPPTAAEAPPRSAPPVSDEPAATPRARPPVDSTDLPAPHAEADFGGPRLISAIAYADDAALLVLAADRRHALRKKIEADEEPAERPAKRLHGRKAKAAEAEAEAPDSVTVGKGDTLYSLSRRAHATVDEVARLNGLKAPYALTPGRTLKLPGAKVAGARKGSAKETAVSADEADAAPKSARDRRKAAAAAAAAVDALETAKAACPRHRGRKACLARAETQAAKVAKAPSQDADDAVALQTAKAACPKHRGRKACLAKAEKQASAQTKPRAPSADDQAASLRTAQAACPKHRGRKACLAKAEKAAAARDEKVARKQDADAATAALNMKACRRRHSRRVCRAEAAEAQGTTTASLTPRRDRRAPVAAVPTPIAPPPVPAPNADLGGSSAADIVASASLPSSSATRPVPRQAADAGASPSPGPRPYASVFGAAATPASTRRGGRDRAGRTSEDAQLAAAAAAKRGYARATIPPVVMPMMPAPEVAGRPRFAWPVTGELLSGFGPKGSGLRNDGLDLAAQTGDPVKASASGEVVYAGGAIPGFGNLVLVKHAGGYVTAYGHLSRITVAMRQAVRQGDVVGEAGQSGNVDRPEVHFEIRYAPSPDESAKPVDPAPLLPRRG